MSLDKNSRFIVNFLLFSVLAVTTVRCQHLLDNFQTMTIDSDTLKVKLGGLLPLISPSPDHDFYQRSSGKYLDRTFGARRK